MRWFIGGTLLFLGIWWGFWQFRQPTPRAQKIFEPHIAETKTESHLESPRTGVIIPNQPKADQTSTGSNSEIVETGMYANEGAEKSPDTLESPSTHQEFSSREVGSIEIPKDLIERREKSIAVDFQTELPFFKIIKEWRENVTDYALTGPYAGRLFFRTSNFPINMSLQNNPTNGLQCFAFFNRGELGPQLFVTKENSLTVMMTERDKNEFVLKLGNDKYIHLLNHSSNRNFGAQYILNYLVGNYYETQPSGQITYKGYVTLQSIDHHTWPSRVRCLDIPMDEI